MVAEVRFGVANSFPAAVRFHWWPGLEYGWDGVWAEEAAAILTVCLELRLFKVEFA